MSDVEGSANTPVKINQDCNVFVTELTADFQPSSLALGSDRQAYMLCVEGSVAAAGEKLQRHDAAKIKGPLQLEVKAGAEGALILMFEMAKS